MSHPAHGGGVGQIYIHGCWIWHVDSTLDLIMNQICWSTLVVICDLISLSHYYCNEFDPHWVPHNCFRLFTITTAMKGLPILIFSRLKLLNSHYMSELSYLQKNCLKKKYWTGSYLLNFHYMTELSYLLNIAWKRSHPSKYWTGS